MSYLSEMEITHKGAEANIYPIGENLAKERIKKKYRHPKLDAQIRRQRTKREAKNLMRAEKWGIPVPKVVDVDEKNNIIIMQKIEGKTIKEVFEQNNKIETLSEDIGRLLRTLHENNLIHNDLTTSNLIYDGKKIFIIDFGLAFHSTRIEDKAMDLIVFKKSIEATHTGQSQTIWRSLCTGYGLDSDVEKRIRQIESRVRYK